MDSELKYAVICVDDDEHVLQMLGYQLEKITNTKTTLLEYFTNPKDVIPCLDSLVAERIEIIFIIVDYQMPVMNGAQLIKEVKLKYPSMKCVMLSGQASDYQVTELMDNEMLTVFIPKPWDEELLRKSIGPLMNVGLA
jgi:DNA-binding NtrC family response regulator